MIFKDNDADKANLIPASVMKRVDNSLVRAIDLEMNGELRWGEEESLGLAEGAVGLSENEFYEKNVPQDVRDLILEVSDKIVSGELKVNSAFGKETSEITDIINSVK